MLEPALFFLPQDVLPAWPRRATRSALQGPGYLCCHHPLQPPPDTLFLEEKKKIKISTSAAAVAAAVVAMEALKPSLCVAPGSSCPYRFMGLAVLMLQCLLAALAEGRKKKKKPHNRQNRGKCANSNTGGERGARAHPRLLAGGWSVFLAPNVKYNPACPSVWV